MERHPPGAAPVHIPRRASTAVLVLAVPAVLVPLLSACDDDGLQVRAGRANPAPVLEDVTPDVAELDGEESTFTVRGRGFVPRSVIRWDGEEVPTEFVDSLELETTLASEELAAAGEHRVTVWTPPPGGGESRPDTVTVFEVDDEIDTGGPGGETD